MHTFCCREPLIQSRLAADTTIPSGGCRYTQSSCRVSTKVLVTITFVSVSTMPCTVWAVRQVGAKTKAIHLSSCAAVRPDNIIINMVTTTRCVCRHTPEWRRVDLPAGVIVGERYTHKSHDYWDSLSMNATERAAYLRLLCPESTEIASLSRQSNSSHLTFYVSLCLRPCANGATAAGAERSLCPRSQHAFKRNSISSLLSSMKLLKLKAFPNAIAIRWRRRRRICYVAAYTYSVESVFTSSSLRFNERNL